LKNPTSIIAAAACVFSMQAFAAGVMPGTEMGQNFNAVQQQNVTGATNPGGGVNKDREELHLSTADGNGPVADAKCTLTNAKGDWSLTTPDTVKVKRSDSDLQIKCEKPGYDAAVTTLKASTIQIPHQQFHFAADGGGDGDEQPATITVPQYDSAVTITFGAKQTSTN